MQSCTEVEQRTPLEPFNFQLKSEKEENGKTGERKKKRIYAPPPTLFNPGRPRKGKSSIE